MAASRTCPICHSHRIRPKFNGRTNRNPADNQIWAVFECVDCTHGFINPLPDADTLSGYYTSSYQAYDETHGAEGDDESVIAKAKRVGEFRHIPVPTGKSVLDFGCGGGFFLRICRGLGADVQGIEPSQYGAEITRRQGISVFEGELRQFLVANNSRRFDVITSNHVIEHVPDPVETLSGLRTVLAPDGQMTIAVPNADSIFARQLREEWHSTDLPFHIHQFSAKSLAIAAQQAGLLIEEMGTTSMASSVGASLRLLLRRNFYIPQKITERLPLKFLYTWLAKHHDASGSGEALLARFRAPPSKFPEVG